MFGDDPIATTGAGDAFPGGVITGRFDGDDEHALAVGNASGTLASQQAGARTNVDRAGLEELLDGSGHNAYGTGANRRQRLAQCR